MADYIDLHRFFTDDSALRKRTEVAVMVAAEVVRAGADNGSGDGLGFIDDPAAHAKRKTWAAAAGANTSGVAVEVLKFVLAANRDATITQIEQANDATLQEKVNEAVDLIAGN